MVRLWMQPLLSSGDGKKGVVFHTESAATSLQPMDEASPFNFLLANSEWEVNQKAVIQPPTLLSQSFIAHFMVC